MLAQRYRALRERGLPPGGSRIDPGLAAGLGYLPPSSVMVGNGCWAMPGALSPADAPPGGDPLRVLLQSLWMIVRRPQPIPLRWPASWQRLWHRGTQTLGAFLARQEERAGRRQGHAREARWKSVLLCVVARSLSLLCVTQPFTLQAQLVFVLLLAAMAFILRAVPGRYPMLMMMVLSSPSPAATSGGATPRPSTGSTPSAWPAACCCWPPRPMPGWCCCSATGRPHGPCTALRHNCRRIRPSGPAWI